MRCPCYGAVDVDPRNATICSRAGVQVNEHQPLLHGIPFKLKRLGNVHQVESGEPFTAARNLLMDIIIRRGGLRGAPDPEDSDMSLLPDTIHVDP